MTIIFQGEALILGTWSFNLAEGWSKESALWWNIVDEVHRYLAPESDGVELTHLGSPHFGEVTLETLREAAYTDEPINGSMDASNQLTPGSVIAVKMPDRLYAKVRINSNGDDALLGISWVTYFDR